MINKKEGFCSCNMCGYSWRFRKNPDEILECPDCKSRNWNIQKNNCVCGHNIVVHLAFPGKCEAKHGCDCKKFRSEDDNKRTI